jgi:hypothetical protein
MQQLTQNYELRGAQKSRTKGLNRRWDASIAFSPYYGAILGVNRKLRIIEDSWKVCVCQTATAEVRSHRQLPHSTDPLDYLRG